MKVSNVLVSVATVALLSHSALGWTNDDHEIFDIVSSLQIAEGKDTTFYTFLNVTQAASEKEISRAYRKRSLELHPDKNPKDKTIAERFARLGVIAGILRDDEKRKRYDHFHDNGVPKWRGTGYYYSRYRPGFGFVVTCLAFFSCIVQYILFQVQRRLNMKNIEAMRQQALDFAWSGKPPGDGKKKFKVQTGPGVAPPGIGIQGYTEGQELVMVCEGQNVYGMAPDGKTEVLIDAEKMTPKHGLKETWLPQYVIGLYQSATGTLPASLAVTTAASSSDEETVDVIRKDGKVEQVVRKVKGPGKGVQEGLGKIGGSRRKALPKKKDA